MKVTTLVIGAERVAGGDVLPVPSLREVTEVASKAQSPYVWLLDSDAVPTEAALDTLLDADCGLAASLPVDAHGRPVEPLLGRFTETDVPGILEAAALRRVPLRHVHVTSLLAPRDVVTAERPPDSARFGRYAGSEWTSRLFAHQAGMLVPRSRVRAPALKTGHPIHAIRMARTGVWGRGEAARELHRSLVGHRRKGG